MDWIYSTTKNNPQNLNFNTIVKASNLVIHTPIEVHNWLNKVTESENLISKIRYIAYHDYDKHTYLVNPKKVIDDINFFLADLDFFLTKYPLPTKINVGEVEMTYLTKDPNISYFKDWISTSDSNDDCELNKKRLIEFFETLISICVESINNNYILYFDED